MSSPTKVSKPGYYGGEAWVPTTITKAVKKIRLSGVKFDSFAARGVSGLVFGAKLAHVMRKNLVVVRKPNESAHSDVMVEGLKPSRYVFVDDFVNTGATKCAVVEGIKARHPSAQLVGVYLYLDSALWIGDKRWEG